MDYNIFKSPLRHFIKAKINGGAVLLFVAAAAMIIANTPLRETYDAFLPKRSFCNSETSTSFTSTVGI